MKNTLVKDIMSTNLIHLSPYDTLLSAKIIFDKESIHHIPIVLEEKLVGILSNTDLERRKQGKTFFIDQDVEKHNATILECTLISEAMTKVVQTVITTDTIFKVYAIFKNHEFRSLPVLENGNLVGIVTAMDFLDYFFSNNSE